MKKTIIALLVLAALGAIAWVSIRSGGRGETAKVYQEPVERREVRRVVKASGEIDPRVKVEISAHVIARIEHLYVKEGDRVEKGAPFLELERAAFVAARDQATAALEIARSRQRQAEIDLEDARVKLRRAERLRRDGVTTEESLESAQLAETSARLRLEQAREGVLQARASLAKAEDDLGKTTIDAPLAGRVIALNAEEGEVVVSGTMNNPASVIGTIADLSEILARVEVDETEIVHVAEGQKAELEVDALPDRTWLGTVTEIGSSGFSRPQQPDVTFFEVEILLAAAEPSLRPGMSVRAEIDTEVHPDALVVPIQAVVERAAVEEEPTDPESDGDSEAKGSEVQVVFVEADGLARQRPVTTGLADETHVEIVDGLEEGESVVTGPYRQLEDLQDGDAIERRDDEEKE